MLNIKKNVFIVVAVVVMNFKKSAEEYEYQQCLLDYRDFMLYELFRRLKVL